RAGGRSGRGGGSRAARRGRRRGRRRLRAARRDGSARRVRSARQSRSARAGAVAPPLSYTRPVIRQAGPQDVRFLRDMLKHAYHWRLNMDPDLPVARYVNNFGRPGDAGLIAWENGPIGAAWYRLFTAREPGCGFVDEQTPELTIAVRPSRRGSGL